MTRTANSGVLGEALAQGGLGRVVHLKDRVRDPERLSQLLSRAIATGLRDPGNGLKLRAFDGTRLDYRLLKVLLENPLDAGEKVPEWIADRGGATSCLATNRLSEWNLTLGDWFVERVAEVQETCGVSFTSRQDTYSFVSGGTGWTPFGIHEDYEPSLIFHLGPSPKRVWVWEGANRPVGVRDEVPAFGGVSFYFDESLSSATEIMLEPGDVLNIPARTYHVFHNDGPSAFVGIAVHSPDPQHDFDEVLLPLAHKLIHEGVPANGSGDAPDANLGAVADLRQAFRAASRDHLASLASAGFVDRPARAVLEALPAYSGPLRLAYSTAVAVSESKLVVRGRTLQSNMTTHVIARLHQALVTLLPVDAEGVAREAGISERAAERFLTTIYRLGGLVPA